MFLFTVGVLRQLFTGYVLWDWNRNIPYGQSSAKLPVILPSCHLVIVILSSCDHVISPLFSTLRQSNKRTNNIRYASQILHWKAAWCGGVVKVLLQLNMEIPISHLQSASDKEAEEQFPACMTPPPPRSHQPPGDNFTEHWPAERRKIESKTKTIIFHNLSSHIGKLCYKFYSSKIPNLSTMVSSCFSVIFPLSNLSKKLTITSLNICFLFSVLSKMLHFLKYSIFFSDFHLNGYVSTKTKDSKRVPDFTAFFHPGGMSAFKIV